MKAKFNNKYFRWGITAFLVLISAIGFYYMLFHGSKIKEHFGILVEILMPVVVGMVIAYLLTPVLNFMERKLLFPFCKLIKIKESEKQKSIVRGVGIIATAVLFAGLIYALFYMLISQIVPSVQNIIVNFDVYTANFTKWINKVLEDNPDVGNYMIKTINKYLSDLEKWMDSILPNSLFLLKTVSLSVLNVFGVLWDFIIGFIISIYVLANKDRFAAQSKKLTFALFEKNTANTIIKNFRFTHKTFVGFLSGKILDSLIIGVLCFIGTSILKTPYAALVSLIIGVTNIIPFFGPFLGAIPSAVLIFIVDPMHPLNVLYFVIFVLVLQQIDGNIIGPMILGDSTGLNGFWVIFSITLFGGLFGVFGMIVGIPIFAVIYAGIRSLINLKLQKRDMPTELENYVRLDYVGEDGFHKLNEKSLQAEINKKDVNSGKKDEK